MKTFQEILSQLIIKLVLFAMLLTDFAIASTQPNLQSVIELRPISAPLIAGYDTLRAEATVAKLGKVAAGVKVHFSIQGLGNIADLSGITDTQGKATVDFFDFPIAGRGQLKVTAIDSDNIEPVAIPVVVVRAPRISIQQNQTQFAIKENQSANLNTTIDFSPGTGDSQTYQFLVLHTITPDDRGLSVTSIDPWHSSHTFKKTVPITVTGLKEGTYSVTTRVNVLTAEGKSVSSQQVTITVVVIKSDMKQPMFLSPPRSEPWAIKLGKSQKTTFTTLVTGGHKQGSLQTVTLCEIDKKGKRTYIGNLYDSGENGDDQKGDGFYSGSFNIDGAEEGVKRYQATAEYQNITITSPFGALAVTSRPIGPAPLKASQALQDPDTGLKYAPGEILVKFKSDLSNTAIDSILAKQGAKVIGSLPGIGVLEIAIPDTGAIAVRQAAAFFGQLPEVEFAEPNILLASGAASPDRPCPNSDINCDWAAIKVRANEVWDVANPASMGSGVRVAVVDAGTHGDRVAALINSGLGDGGITGIAPMATVTKYFGTPYASHVADAIDASGNSQNKIINLSIWEDCTLINGNCILNYSPDINSVASTIASALNDRLFVTISGNHKGTTEPALVASVHGKQGLVVGATNFNDQRASILNPIPQHPTTTDPLCPPNLRTANSGWCLTNPGSGYGSWVDIAAPGENVCVGITGTNCIFETGTSFAAPLVTGAATLIFAQNPTWSASRVTCKLKRTAVPLGAQFCENANGQCAGRLDVYNALNAPNIVDSNSQLDSVIENAANGTAVGIVASDPCADSPAYSLSNNPNNLFAINSTSGVITVNGMLDYESSNSHSVTVVATGSDSVVVSADFTIPVANINDNSPVITSGNTASVAENSPVSTVIYNAVATDADHDPITWSLSGLDANLLNINTNNGEVTLKAPADYETKASYHFNVVANDGIHLSNQPVVLTITNVSEPVNLAMILDRSGSMQWAVPGLNPENYSTRIEALVAGVNDYFIPDIFNLNPPVGSSLSLTLFSDAALVLANPNFTSLRSLDTPNLANEIEMELDPATSHTNEWRSTSIGSGVHDGLTKFGNSNSASNSKAIILFTDGEQNTPPFVTDDGRGICSVSSSSLSSCPNSVETIPSDVKIISIGIGDPSSSYHQILQNLAINSRNGTYISANGAAISNNFPCIGSISEAFNCAASLTLADNSPQMVSFVRGTSDNKSKMIDSFEVNKGVSLILLSLNIDWNRKDSKLEAISKWLSVQKDGADVTQFFDVISYSNKNYHVILKASASKLSGRLDQFQIDGKYSVILRKPEGIEDNINYSLLTFVDDHKLHMDWQIINPKEPRADKKFTPSISLTWKGQALNDVTVSAQILQPGDDLGDLLARTPAVDLHIPVAGNELTSVGQKKYLALLKTRHFLQRLASTSHRHKLVPFGDGSYRSIYDPNQISGVYQILYHITAEDPLFGKIQRIAVESVYVSPGEIDEKSSVLTNKIDGSTVSLRFRPITSYGKYIGPGQIQAFKFSGENIKVQRFEEEGQDGTYNVVLNGDPDTLIDVKYLGKSIYYGKASDFGRKPKQVAATVFYWIIWILIIILLLWFIR